MVHLRLVADAERHDYEQVEANWHRSDQSRDQGNDR
jgi:hypothetical protein